MSLSSLSDNVDDDNLLWSIFWSYKLIFYSVICIFLQTIANLLFNVPLLSQVDFYFMFDSTP